MNRGIRLAFSTVFLVLFLSSCGAANDGTGRSSRPPDSNTPESSAPDKPAHDVTVPDEEKNNNEYSLGDTAEAVLSGMTLEEKIGQMLFIACRYDAAGGKLLVMDEYLKGILSEYKPGGFIIFGENLYDIDQTVELIQNIKDCSRIPPFISIDEEGGRVSRLNKATLLGSTVMPSACEIGLTENPANAYIGAGVIAKELSSLGFNMDFAPVADIFSNPENTVIGERAYGTDPASVSPMVVQAVKGFKDNNIIPVLKHFPGHGDTRADTHTDAAEVTHDMERIESFELLPFKAGIEAGADAVMVAHIMLPNITPEPVPASLSKEIITGILRERLGFDGVVMTDALEMKAISSYYDSGEATVKAVEAGADMLMMPVSVEEAYRALLAEVQYGELTIGRIDESVRRILVLKEKYRLFDGTYDRPKPESILGCPEHEAIAERIRKDAGLE